MGYGSKSIQDWQDDCHAVAVKKGWWPSDLTEREYDVRFELARIAVQHMNLSFRLEAHRRGDPVPELVAAEVFLLDASSETIDNLAKMALIHSEVSEAVEAILDGKLKMEGGGFTGPEGSDGKPTIVKPEGAVVELADVVIRIMDWCGRRALSLEGALRSKYYYNLTRPQRHGGKLA